MAKSLTWKLADGETITFTAAELTVGDIATADLLAGGGWDQAGKIGDRPAYDAALIAAVVARRSGGTTTPVVEYAKVCARPALDLVLAVHGDPSSGS